MKKMLSLLAAVVLAAGTVSAQTTPVAAGTAPMARQGRMGQGQMNMTPEQHADMMSQRLTKQLSLSPDQTAKVREMALAQGQEMQALRAKYPAGSDRRAALPEMKALKDKYDAQLKTILTPEQAAQYEQKRDDQMDKRKEMRKSRMKS